MSRKFSINGDSCTNIEHVDWKHLDEKEKIGQGPFSDTHKAIWTRGDSSRKVALKKLRNRNPEKYNEREITFLSAISHENIVTLFGISESTDFRSILILEYSECGSLDKYLYLPHEGCVRSLKYSDSLRWMHQLAMGMDYLHRRNIIHRDLKPQKILLFNNYQTLKISGFRFVIENVSKSTNSIGTAAYMAPEIHNGEMYTLASDVYSFGIIFWEVLARKKPFWHIGIKSSVEVSFAVCRGKRPDIKEIKSTDIVPEEQFQTIKKLLKASWDANILNRPTMQSILFCFVNTAENYYLDVRQLQARRRSLLNLSYILNIRGH